MNFTPERQASAEKNGTESAENCLQLKNIMLISSETFSFRTQLGKLQVLSSTTVCVVDDDEGSLKFASL